MKVKVWDQKTERRWLEWLRFAKNDVKNQLQSCLTEQLTNEQVAILDNIVEQYDKLIELLPDNYE